MKTTSNILKACLTEKFRILRADENIFKVENGIHTKNDLNVPKKENIVICFFILLSVIKRAVFFLPTVTIYFQFN